MSRPPVRILCVPGDDRELGDDWLLATLGNSSDDGKDYYVTTDRLTDRLHGTDIPDELCDAKSTAELIVTLLNDHFTKRKHPAPENKKLFP